MPSAPCWTASSPTWRISPPATVKDGIPLPRYAAQIKAAAGANGRYVHLGSTSQDIMDSALALTLMEINDTFDSRLIEILDKLKGLVAKAHGQRSMMGRTRMQAALSITVADRLREWSLPLERQRERLVRLRPAAGDRAVRRPRRHTARLERARRRHRHAHGGQPRPHRSRRRVAHRARRSGCLRRAG